MHSFVKKSIVGLAFMLGTSACTPRIDIHGKLPEPEALEQIQQGQHTREDVMRLIGSPSSASDFGQSVWYYLYKKTKTVSFLTPEVLDEKLILITFDKNGYVEQVLEQDGKGQKIEPVKRSTPTLGQERPILEQVFGSFGRLAKRESQGK